MYIKRARLFGASPKWFMGRKEQSTKAGESCSLGCYHLDQLLVTAAFMGQSHSVAFSRYCNFSRHKNDNNVQGRRVWKQQPILTCPNNCNLSANLMLPSCNTNLPSELITLSHTAFIFPNCKTVFCGFSNHQISNKIKKLPHSTINSKINMSYP